MGQEFREVFTGGFWPRVSHVVGVRWWLGQLGSGAGTSIAGGPGLAFLSFLVGSGLLHVGYCGLPHSRAAAGWSDFIHGGPSTGIPLEQEGAALSFMTQPGSHIVSLPLHSIDQPITEAGPG